MIDIELISKKTVIDSEDIQFLGDVRKFIANLTLHANKYRKPGLLILRSKKKKSSLAHNKIY